MTCLRKFCPKPFCASMRFKSAASRCEHCHPIVTLRPGPMTNPQLHMVWQEMCRHAGKVKLRLEPALTATNETALSVAWQYNCKMRHKSAASSCEHSCTPLWQCELATIGSSPDSHACLQIEPDTTPAFSLS